MSRDLCAECVTCARRGRGLDEGVERFDSRIESENRSIFSNLESNRQFFSHFRFDSGANLRQNLGEIGAKFLVIFGNFVGFFGNFLIIFFC